MKYKKILPILTIIFVVLFSLFVYFSLKRPKPATQTNTVPIIPSEAIPLSPKGVDVSSLSKNVADPVAQKEVASLTSLLPLYGQNIQTSSDIITEYNIFSLSSDPKDIIHIEIYGINYNLSDASPDNPQAIAFIETFTQIKKLLSEKDINLNKLKVLYGNREYIQKTAEYWIKAFNLLP